MQTYILAKLKHGFLGRFSIVDSRLTAIPHKERKKEMGLHIINVEEKCQKENVA